jgi:hypothetical protein
MVMVVLYQWVLRIPEDRKGEGRQTVLPSWRRRRLATALLGIGLLVLLAFLSRRPYYDTYPMPILLQADTDRIAVHANVAFTRTRVIYRPGADPRIQIHARGFAFPKAGHEIHIRQEVAGRTVHIYSEVKRSGYHAELNHSCEIALPQRLENKIEVDFNASR